MEREPIIGITMGDPAGIGPEVIAKALLRPEIYSICSPLVIGDLTAMERISTHLGLGISFRGVESVRDCHFKKGSPEVLNLGNLPHIEIPWDRPSPPFCKAAIEYVEAAIDLCLTGAIDAMSTAPVNKGELVKAGYMFTGHTELLAQRTGAQNYAMMLAGEDFRVVLATTHVPLGEVAARIKKERILGLLRVINRSMPLFGIEHPRIGVAALNPHAGDDGAMGEEETREIIPAVKAASSEGIDAYGPYPADTLFIPSNWKHFDVFLAMYHDQGLIPLKSRSFLSAVNITMGLPIIRTSVDHGTAYDIAGKGQADPSSMLNALKTAAALARRRSSSGE